MAGPISKANIFKGTAATVIPVQNIDAFSFKYCTTDTQIKAGAGYVHTITFTPLDVAATEGTIILYDKLTEAAPIAFSLYIPAAFFAPVTVTLDINMSTGIYLGFTTTADVGVTISYR